MRSMLFRLFLAVVTFTVNVAAQGTRFVVGGRRERSQKPLSYCLKAQRAVDG